MQSLCSYRVVKKSCYKVGKAKSTPCAFIERGTTKNERIITGNLGNIIDKANQYSVRSPAVFIVGEIINYGKSIYGYKFK